MMDGAEEVEARGKGANGKGKKAGAVSRVREGARGKGARAGAGSEYGEEVGRGGEEERGRGGEEERRRGGEEERRREGEGRSRSPTLATHCFMKVVVARTGRISGLPVMKPTLTTHFIVGEATRRRTISPIFFFSLSCN
ncbi:hypothetical protein Pcinc_023441 [Petrolisthes cinctipes]|uniref:Uncharacterized protein n=1 Tax=Petrolisthes cinctipes TaxID=88211 RepID=A0AAE1FD79_PETCI|nr:hypothetical protein Pcinc_023441 [Petrolisthes cinctipes]